MQYRTWFKALLPVAFVALVVLFGRLPGEAMAAASTAAPSPVQYVKGTVTFTLPAGTCSTLPADLALSGTGKQYSVITTKVKPDGSTLVINNNFVQGTATDNHGGTYDFLYANQDRHQVAKSGAPINVNMTDTFTLSGNGGVNNYNVAFKWSWTYSPPDQEWPPVNNWKKIYTLGDPLTCDPL